ncbi:hypothetical protein ONS95_011588 [Cadophora gregata]|uniref:uncharacterized protein n=1 Tax=Cadophora gregata TaxID=51156 RepID=UPI0026DD52EE|nr:uncharacterized protein ONS95_011588 [Cadophora gregata]KAK0120182.1 hypothetical protein ONS95_011588 [Cadophora gregata]KAK0121212.1 hypothetical protein ONS96_011389 [Cadophora gregata f. sp. sojae]
MQLSRPITLKCGLILPNRLVKAAVAESMAPGNNLPDEQFHSLYAHWAGGGWGMIVTGNVQVDTMFLGTHSDLAVDNLMDDDTIISAWKSWATILNKNNTPTVMQLNHPGRQSPTGAGRRSIFAKSIAPSAIPLDLGSGVIAQTFSALVFGIPREMTLSEIRNIVKQFARAARLAAQSGFAGVEVHAAHGYLLHQFLSEASNKRTDSYGGTPENRVRIVVEIIKAIRAEVPAGFCVGIVLSSPDPPLKLFDIQALQIKSIIGAGIDFIEVSGGTFENPSMFTGPHAAPNLQPENGLEEPFFAEFAEAVGHLFPDIPLILTGGFRSCQSMEKAIARGVCQCVGLGRPAVINPVLPKSIALNPTASKEIDVLYTKKIEAPWYVKLLGVRALNVHFDNAWYIRQLKEMASEKSITVHFRTTPFSIWKPRTIWTAWAIPA